MEQIEFKKIISHCKEYGFIFPSSEIYDGVGGVYDYGQNGVEIKNNIKNYWWKSMVHDNENIFGLDAAIFMHPTTWKASGHVDAFSDPMIDNLDSKKRYRADTLIEDYIDSLENDIFKEIEKAKKRFGENFDKEKYLKESPKLKEINNNINTIKSRFVQAMDNGNLAEMRKIIIEFNLKCPVSGTKNWTNVRKFNLMFETQMGSLESESQKIYLRPETAQGIFVNFLNVQKTARAKIPFGIAQIGKAFRNEIVARQFIFRMKEFEQMEMQFFIQPGTEMTWYEFWKDKRMKWHQSFGLGKDKYRFHNHDNLAHYANAACDIQYNFPIGFKELEGIHSRTNFDLSNHEKYSGKKLQYFDTEKNESYIPYVLETSVGLDRLVLATISGSYNEEKLEDGSIREVLKLPSFIAPKKVAILPLVNKDGLYEKSEKIYSNIKLKVNSIFDDGGSIGKRYRRQDAIGTPFSVTIDHQTMEDQTVTIRNRDTMKQERINEEKIIEYIIKH